MQNKHEEKRNLAHDVLCRKDSRIKKDFIILLPNRDLMDESSKLYEVYITRTADTLTVAKVFISGEITTTEVFTHDPDISMLHRDDNFLSWDEVSRRMKSNFPYIDADQCRIVAYPYPTSWKAYAIRHGENVIIFLDLSTGCIQVRV